MLVEIPDHWHLESVSCPKGMRIEEAAQQLLEFVNEIDEPRQLDFNNVKIWIHPGDDIDTIMGRWYAAHPNPVRDRYDM